MKLNLRKFLPLKKYLGWYNQVLSFYLAENSFPCLHPYPRLGPCVSLPFLHHDHPWVLPIKAAKSTEMLWLHNWLFSILPCVELNSFLFASASYQWHVPMAASWASHCDTCLLHFSFWPKGKFCKRQWTCLPAHHAVPSQYLAGIQCTFQRWITSRVMV